MARGKGTKKYPYEYLVVFLAAFLAGEGVAIFDNDRNQFIGGGLIFAGFVAVALQLKLYDLRNTRRITEFRNTRRAEVSRAGEETCVFEMHVHRGEIIAPDGALTGDLDLSALGVQATTKTEDVSLKNLALMVRRVADDLDREYRKRVAEAN